MAEPNKDTIYIDIDDEITGIIDKLRASPTKIVALVLPKRAAVFQSIVNMKLLKRAADDTKKNIVLITSEAGLLPLAGAAGVHVAKTLSSKPEIPTAPTVDDTPEEALETDDETDEEEITAATAGDQPVGKLAGLAGADDVETLELDDDEAPETADDTPTKGKEAAGAAALRDKKLHVPDFDRFRLKLILGGLILILLIFLLILATKVLPKASINVATDASNINANLSLNLSSATTALDPSTNTLPAKVATQPKAYTQQVLTTGQKNQGTKATGKVTLSLNDCADPQVSIPAGTGVTNNGLTFITQESATLSSVKIGSQCKNSSFPTFSTATVDVTAQTGGAQYNVAAGSYNIAGFSNVSGSGTAMSGGTDNVVQIVTQTDIDNAKGKIATTDAAVKQTLEDQLKQAGYLPIVETFSPGTPTITPSANVGDAASSVTVTEAVTYIMFGVHQSDLKTVVDNEVKKQIDVNKQTVLSEGLTAATFNVNNATATTAQVAMTTTAEAGPQLNVNAIKKAAAGKKSGDIKSQIQTNPDVTNVTVKLSPFWVTSAPTNTSKITVNIAKPTKTSKNASH